MLRGYIIIPTLVGSDTGYGVLTAGISNTAVVKLELRLQSDIILSYLEKTTSNFQVEHWDILLMEVMLGFRMHLAIGVFKLLLLKELQTLK
ncbi:MAG: hypothetical protein MZV65_43805 [Chromatiales bacterium]|nr:hypothetical protein [Chromatiales bacterium]